MEYAAQTIFARKSSCAIYKFDDFGKEEAEAMLFRLVKELAEKEKVIEELKAADQMLWVQRMNNIRNRATEIVNAELIYTV